MKTPKKKDPRGGPRPGSGRPAGRAADATLQIRLAASQKDKFRRHAAKTGQTLSAWVVQACENVEHRCAAKPTQQGDENQ